MPLIIGVTGAIATGKSTVCRTLIRLGAEHCDADRLVHRLYDPGTPGFDRVVAAFGPAVVGDDGYIDRRILGSRVFGKPDEMKRLTTAIGSITEVIKEVVDVWRATLPDDSVAVVEAVNMIEPGYSAWLDQTWLVASDTEQMRRRLMARNQLDSAEAEQRVASQRLWGERAPAADAVFYNNGSLDELAAEVETEFRRVLTLYRQGRLPECRWQAWSRETGVQAPA